MDSDDQLVSWLKAAGYSVDGRSWIYPDDADSELASYVFAEYERRTGWPLSVANGRTGSYGPLFAPRVVDLLGRGHPQEHQHRIVARLLDAVIESGDWLHAFTVVRAEFEEVGLWRRLRRWWAQC